MWGFFAAAAVLFYFATGLYISSHRLLWFDEVFTAHMAGLKFFALMSALHNGVDSLPPPYYLVVGVFAKLFGNNAIAFRLPSTLAIAATLLIVFDCARRLSDGLHGLIALALASGPLAGEGFEARSYAIYVMLAALAFWVWACSKSSARRTAILFGAVLFLAVCFHYYAVLLLVPFAIFEATQWRPWQRPSAKLIAGAIGVTLPAVLLSPFILSFSRKFSGGFWSRPSLSELVGIYPHIFEAGFLLLALIAVWMVLVDRRPASFELPAMQSAEAIGWLFLAIPLAGFIAAELKTNAFAVRYFLGIVPGVAIAFACCMWRQFRHVPVVSVGILLLLGGWGVTKQLQTLRHIDSVETPGTRSTLAIQQALNSDGKQFLVFSDPFQFLEVQYYSRHPQQCILLLPDDFEQQHGLPRSTPDPYIHQRVELLLSHYYPLKFWRTAELRANAGKVALIKPPADLLEALKGTGAVVTDRMTQPVTVVYLQ